MSDRRSGSRFKIVLPALCWGRRRPDFYAVTEDVSMGGIRFRSSVLPSVDETLTCSIRHAGSLEAIVVRAAGTSFAIRVLGADYPLGLVVRSLVRLAKAQNPPVPVMRTHPRVVPDARDVLVTTETGSILPGRLLNVSASGAAVSLDEPLEVGTLITIGGTKAKVSRRFDNGIGAAFLAPLRQDAVGPDVLL